MISANPVDCRLFGRELELAEIIKRLEKRAPFLLHGASGMGKTMLLNCALTRLAADSYVHCAETKALNQLAKALCTQLAMRGDPCTLSWLKLKRQATTAQIQAAIAARSSAGLRGIARQSLREQPRMIVCDHVAFVSQQFYNYLKEFELQCRVPIVSVAHSHHMEEIGYLSPYYGDKRARVELKGFEPDLAAAFAARMVESEPLEAENAEEFLDNVVKSSRGNPFAILRMIAMTRNPLYRAGKKILVSLIYVDYCMQHGPPGQ